MNRTCLALLITSVLHSAFVVAGDTGNVTTTRESAVFGIAALL